MPGTRYIVPGAYGPFSTVCPNICKGVLAAAFDADHPTRTLTLTVSRTLWGGLCLDAVACEGSRLIRSKGVLWMGGAYFKLSHPGVRIFSGVFF